MVDYILDLPWGFKHHEVKYDKLRKVSIYTGSKLPQELAPYASEDFSYLRWIQDEINTKKLKKPYRTPTKKSETKFTLKEHQAEAAKKILKSYNNSWPSFICADLTGVGKTLSTLGGVSVVARAAGFNPTKKANLLVVCPKGVIPQWRHTLHNFPASTSLMNVMIISYHSLGKLLNPPKETPVKGAKKTKRKPSARVQKRRKAINGAPKYDWDYIIFDESHHLKNYPDSLMSLEAVNIAKINKPYIKGKSPFVIFSTATPGSSPMNFSVMANSVSRMLDPKLSKQIAPSAWGTFLDEKGFSVKKSDKKKSSPYRWISLPAAPKPNASAAEKKKYEIELKRVKQVQKKDAIKIGKALISPDSPFIRRSPSDLAGWPEQQYISMPVEMTKEQIPVYREVWSRFRKWLNLSSASKDPKGALVEMLRYRQKSSLLKVDSMIENVVDFVDSGNQVYISCQFIETIDRYKEKLESKGLKVVEISGRTSEIREAERIKFQKGNADIALCTVVAGISLHAEETLPDGSKASKNPRVTVLHDLRLDPNDSIQALGRCHRDGINSLTYFPYLEGTVEENVVARFVNKSSNMQLMTGSESEAVAAWEDVFRKG